MTSPRDAAFHVEAKLHAFRKTQDGVVVSFVVSPIDMPPQLALDPLGTRYMLGVCAIGDDEMPVPPDSSAGHFPPGAPVAAPPAGEPYAAKERYAAMSLSEQARVRSALLPRDEQFRAWVAHVGRPIVGEIASEQEAIEHIRDTCCNGGSRALITEDPECYDKFLAMETEFKIATGQMAEPR